jgi:hypothetical protein
MAKSSENLFERGERLTAQKLNKLVKRRPTMSGSGRINSSGDDDSIEIDLTEVIHLRVTESNTTFTPVRYGWIQVYREDGANLTANKTWNNITTRTANATDDYAIELNDGSITVGDNQVYRAERSLTTGEWLISKGGGGANTKTQSNPIIMLLGPWADYKDCPGVPAKPPTFTANGTDFCVPPYAWAAYDVCNYKYVKKFDMRDFGHWATELNGGSATAFRRLYNAYYGNSTESANLTANTTTNCKGVRFLGFSSQSSLVCTCPSWMTPVKCLMLKFKTIPRPCAAPSTCGYSCASTFAAMDENNMWDTEYTVQLCSTISCFFTGTVGSTPWTVDLQFLPAYTADQCFWGPDIIDPCNPCDGFGKFTLGILSGIQASDCGGAGIITSTITDIEMKDLVTNCVTKKPTNIKMCNNCQNAGVPINFILPDTIELSCCSPKNLGTCP